PSVVRLLSVCCPSVVRLSSVCLSVCLRGASKEVRRHLSVHHGTHLAQHTVSSYKLCHLCFQKPVPEPPYIQRHHRVCTYSRIRHMTARLPGCQPNISSLYHYPMALHCHCAICSTQDTDGGGGVVSPGPGSCHVIMSVTCR
uniref:Si:dkey-23i12.9 n=1 Tax=Cynoglossus semilaevis TaxID=244447 RepID=A0A3P8W8F1_CYNSE